MKKGMIGLACVSLASLTLVGFSCFNTENKSTTTETKDNTSTTTTSEETNVASKLTDAQILADTDGAWATSAVASTTYNDAVGNASWSAKQVTGAPDVTAYGDYTSAWAPKSKNSGQVTLEVAYVDAVYATNVRIHENYGSGSVIKVELKDTNGIYNEVWSGVDPTKNLNYLQVNFSKRTYLSNTVRITLDTTKVPDEWTEVDAVQLVGTK
jgi:hypothetical protein